MAEKAPQTARDPHRAPSGFPLITIERREIIGTVFEDVDGDNLDPLGVAFEILVMHVLNEVRHGNKNTVHGRFTFTFENQTVELNMGDFTNA